jgi:hypothetical protein
MFESTGSVADRGIRLALAGRQLCIAAYDLSPSLSTYCSYADDWNFVARTVVQVH